MRVISLIQRENGHSVRLGDRLYSFKPPEYACDVVDAAHANVFRLIPEGYQVERDVITQKRKPRLAPPMADVTHEAG